MTRSSMLPPAFAIEDCATGSLAVVGVEREKGKVLKVREFNVRYARVVGCRGIDGC